MYIDLKTLTRDDLDDLLALYPKVVRLVNDLDGNYPTPFLAEVYGVTRTTVTTKDGWPIDSYEGVAHITMRNGTAWTARGVPADDRTIGHVEFTEKVWVL